MNDKIISNSAFGKNTDFHDSSVKIAVVIPCYRVKPHIDAVLAGIGDEIWRIYVIDDGCSESSGLQVQQNCRDPRVRVIQHVTNLGVGAAVMSGYRAALSEGADIIVKVDGDGQMNPALICTLVSPILNGDADYTKGNRFFDLRGVARMPRVRVLGNIVLSFMSKLSTGYWDIFDPTNGFTAIHANIVSRLPMADISPRYFFETDMLFRLNTLRAVVVDVPMDAKYGNEISSISLPSVVFEFSIKHVRNLIKRIGYNYFLRDMSVASIELLIALLALPFGLVFGVYHWYQSSLQHVATPVGTIMIAVLALVFGLQLLLAFLSYDIANVPRRPINGLLPCRRELD